MTNEELVQKYYHGDADALEQLCEQLSKLVRSLAHDTAELFNGADKEELYNVGMLKMMELLNTKSYDPSRAKLSTYIYPHIQGNMRRWMEKNSASISLDQLLEDGYDFPSGASMEYAVYRIMLVGLVEEQFRKLPARDQYILGSYYGVFGFEEMSLDDLAFEEMLTIEGARKANEAALQRLQELCANSKIPVLKWAYRAVNHFRHNSYL